MKNRTIAILLCLFLGGLGAHRFYLGQTVRGLLCIAFCWTFIPALFALIDLFGLIMMSDETFGEKYNHMSGEAVETLWRSRWGRP